MPFDGILTKCIASELNEELSSARIDKIHMPEKNEIILSLRSQKGSCKLLINVNSNMARIHLTTMKKDNPISPPMFCMLLRKYLVGGRILSIQSYGFERVIIIEAESTSELGDRSVKKLIIEIMGKHSNIILLNSNDTIIDSIFHVDSAISSKREVMPARPYEWPPTQSKISLLDINEENLYEKLRNYDGNAEKAVLDAVLGFSPSLAREVCVRSGINLKIKISDLDDKSISELVNNVKLISIEIQENKMFPAVYYSNDRLIDFHCIRLMHIENFKKFETINHSLDYYYNQKGFEDKLTQSKQVILKIIHSNQERCVKKLSLQQKAVSDSKNFDASREIGDILTANFHLLKTGESEVTLQNFYSDSNDEITIEIDETLSPQKNAQKYYKKYSKLKKTFEQSIIQVSDTTSELEYLDTIEEAIIQSECQEDLVDIRLELESQGYISLPKKPLKRSNEVVSPPNEYLSSDGFVIFSGKNNRQNDLLTLKSSKADDFWFHTQKIPGSHVIIKTNGKNVPERTIEEAALISAYHSRAKNSSKVPVDYTLVRNVKKPPGAKPGMVTYEKFKTIFITPDEAVIRKLTITK